MDNLEGLVIYDNNLSGSLPKLKNPEMSHLLFSGNLFEGTLPSEYVLHLGFNSDLTGTIPEAFGKLEHLGKKLRG
jgi:hypothetical protein